MSDFVALIDRHFYPGIGKNWDDSLFRARIIAHLSPGAHVLDIGAGAGIVPQMNFRGLAAHVCGLDPDPRVADNPFLDAAKVGFGEAIPWDDESFDLVFADNVAEHLANPQAVFAEVARVLRPGGRFLIKTPNRNHYVPLIARLTPHGFHRYINSLRGRDGEDTFPTLYRANSPAAVRRLADETGLAVDAIELIESRPEYLRLAAPAYLLGTAYERIVNATPYLERFRILLIASFVRK